MYLQNHDSLSWKAIILPLIPLVQLGFSLGSGPSIAFAQDTSTDDTIAPQVVETTQLDQTDYFSSQKITFSDGSTLKKDSIAGPPTRPDGYELSSQSVSLPEANQAAGTNSLTVPAYEWVFGCSSVSAAMIAAYYDRNGYADIYTGPTNNGVMPLDSSSWDDWTDDNGDTYASVPLAASQKGVDGRTEEGSIDDYWVAYDSTDDDPYISGSWDQHTWGDAIGDYMKTSQSAYDNSDGSTTFYNYTSSATQLTCSDMVNYNISTLDGTYGRKLFYEAKGYAVTNCYNQVTDNQVTGGFSFSQFEKEIDAGRPVMINLEGHTVVGIGYVDSTDTIYIHDTWDYKTHSMTWGGSYSGMQMLSVSIVNLGTLTNLEIDGSSSIKAKNSSTYTATATWSDGSTSTVTPTWSEDSDYTTISSSGVLQASALPNGQKSSTTVTITASYTAGDVTETASKMVTITNDSMFPLLILPSTLHAR